MVPPAAAPPVTGLIDGYVVLGPPVPGWLAVPVRNALSLIVLPRTHGVAEQLASVDSVGVTGATVKHSLVPSSSAGETPASFEAWFGSKWAVQQYLPTDVRVAVPETKSAPDEPWLTVLLVTGTP